MKCRLGWQAGALAHWAGAAGETAAGAARGAGVRGDMRLAGRDIVTVVECPNGAGAGAGLARAGKAGFGARARLRLGLPPDRAAEGHKEPGIVMHEEIYR